jgi:HKD family nuclease
MSDEKELISNEVPLLVDNKNQGSEKDLDFFMVHITMSEAINQILEKSDYSLFLCATGYFHPLGWDLIKKELEKCQKVYLLIGRPYLIPKDSESILKKTYQELLEDIPIQDLHLWTFIPDLIKWLKEEYVLVRLHESPFLHGKMYWTPSNAYVGSSNLTKDGLAINTELNVLLNNPNQIELLKKWFFNRWNEHGSIPHKDELIETLDKSRFGAYPYHPFIVYMKAVYEYYKDLLDIQDMTKKSVVDLAKFQKQGVNKALQILATHNGVMISDSVGLGKSFILMSLLDQCHPRRVLLLAPAQLRESWRMNLETYNLDRVVEFYSIEKLATQIPQKVTGEAFDYDYIAIDESHAFRNPETKRYRNLMKLLPRGKFQSKIILLTATPINTSIMDLYYQMKIITKGTDRYPSIQDVGIPSLLDYFKDVMKPADSPEHKDIDVLKQNLMIARSRSEIRFRQDVLNEDIYIPTKNNGRKLIKFPKRSLPPVEYSLFPKLEQDIEKTSKNDAKLFYKEIGDILYELKLPAITIELYKKAEFQDNKILLRTNAIINML